MQPRTSHNCGQPGHLSFNCPNNQMPAQMSQGQPMYPTQTFQQPAQRGYFGPMAQPYVPTCQPLQLMPQSHVTEGQTNQTSPAQVNVTEHEPNETEQIKLTPATKDTDFYVGCHFTLLDNEEDEEDEEPQPAAHQVYMMEQDDDDDMEDDDYWW